MDMFGRTFSPAQVAAVAAGVLITGVAAFQVALALGVSLGDAVLGGRAETVDGVLQAPFRVLAVAQAIILLLLAWVLLARTGVVTIPVLGRRALVGVTWGIVVFLGLNTVANFSAPHPVERWVMGSTTLVLFGLGLFVALKGRMQPDGTPGQPHPDLVDQHDLTSASSL